MNPFEKMIDDIFNIPEFKEYFTTENGLTVDCISYETDFEPVYTEYGFDDGISFYLSCKVKDYTPKKGEKLTYKNKAYKIDTFKEDSFSLTYNIFLRSVTSK